MESIKGRLKLNPVGNSDKHRTYQGFYINFNCTAIIYKAMMAQ